MSDYNALINKCRAFIAPSSVISCVPLSQGLSNENVLINTTQEKYLLKRYKDHWPEYALEAQRRLSASNICPSPVWLDKQNQLAVFNYFDGSTAKSLSIDDVIKKLVTVHAYSASTEPMNIAQELSCYKCSPVYLEHQQLISAAVNFITAMPIELGFCHNDLIKDNLIVNESGSYLIDFEYAKTNDVYFDLAALSVSFELNKNNDDALLNSYAKYKDKQVGFVTSTDKLNCYKLLFLVLSIGWYEQRDIRAPAKKLRAQLLKLIAACGF
jgi:thiamine kinase